MYLNGSVNVQVAQVRHQDLLAAAQRARRAREAKSLAAASAPASASQPPASRRGRAWQLLHLRPQAQTL